VGTFWPIGNVWWTTVTSIIVLTAGEIVDTITKSVSNQGLMTTVPSIKSTLSKVIGSITFIVYIQSFITTISFIIKTSSIDISDVFMIKEIVVIKL
jgi:hypothetical protein